MSLFQPAFKKLLRWEGGYVNDPSDPGGETNFGITKKSLEAFKKDFLDNSFPEIKNLTENNARTFYFVEYWSPLRLHDIQSQDVSNMLLSFAVNQGAVRAVSRLQGVLGVQVDGRIGPVTIAAINKMDPVKLCNDYCAATSRFYKKLVALKPSLKKFEYGWMNRVYDYTVKSV